LLQRVAGLSRPPLLTATLTALTAAVSVAGLISPGVLDALERTPTALHGEPWRWLTSLVVQDGGVLGTASNLLFLVVLGAAAEQVVGRATMAVCYLGAGLTGQLAGVVWQPVGAGNSVAVCGLAGLVAWSLRHERTPGWAGSALALWLGALLSTWWPPLFAVGVVGTALDRAAARRRPAIRMPVAVVASVVVAAVLIAVGNVHGPALAVGTLAGAVTVRPRRATR
jgi:membrane associated rhomboid family serine protease